jgi:hypothetical protein
VQGEASDRHFAVEDFPKSARADCKIRGFIHRLG